MTNGAEGRFNNLPTSTGLKRRRYKSYATGTYVKLIACVIQDSPNKMLKFKQIMNKLEPFVFGERKSIENNIRVCLSSNSCFTKVPVNPQCPNPKNNYWKVDERGITPKMLRRHFIYLIDKFPGLSFQTHQMGTRSIPPPLLPVGSVAENTSGVRFTGPFSIDSLLKGDREVMRMRSTCLEERPQQEDAQCTAVKRIHFNNSTEFYSPNRLVSELNLTEIPRLSAGPQFGLSMPPQIPYDHRVFYSNFNSSPLMCARYVGW